MTRIDLDNLYKNNAKIKYQWLDMVQEDKSMTSSAILIAMTLVSYCGNNGKMFPSREQLSDKTHLGLKTISRAKDSLIKAGYLIQQRQVHNNRYHFVLKAEGHSDLLQRVVATPTKGHSDLPNNITTNIKYNIDNNIANKIIKKENTKHLTGNGCPCSTCSTNSGSTADCIYD